MPTDTEAPAQSPPKPSPALRRLDRLVGTWRMEGRSSNADDDDIRGTTTYEWLNGDGAASFFLQQDMEMDYDGMLIRSQELIGYDPATKAFASYVYSNMAPDPWPYEWDVQGDTLTISIKHGPMAASFRGTFSSDGRSLTGGWRPHPGADEAINAPYDIRLFRV